MRHIYQGTFKDQNGAVVGSSTTSDGNPGTVTVYLAGGTTLASVYTASTGGVAVNSVTTDAYGYFYFWVDDTVYPGYQLFKITLTHPDFTTRTYDNIRIIILTPDMLNDVKYFGAIGDGTADDRTACATADSTATGYVKYTPGTYKIGSDLTLTTPIVIDPGAMFSIPNGVTLTLNCPVTAGISQIFSWGGTGKVVFGTGSVDFVRPEWWGAVGDADYTTPTNGTDDSAALQACLTSSMNSTYRPKIVFFSKCYRFATALTIDFPAMMTIEGQGGEYSSSSTGDPYRKATTLWYTGAGTALTLGGVGAGHGFRMSGIVLQGTSSALYGIYLSAISGSVFRDMTIAHFSKSGAGGLTLDASHANTFYNIAFVSNYYGSYLTTGATSENTTNSFYSCVWHSNTNAGHCETWAHKTMIVGGVFQGDGVASGYAILTNNTSGSATATGLMVIGGYINGMNETVAGKAIEIVGESGNLHQYPTLRDINFTGRGALSTGDIKLSWTLNAILDGLTFPSQAPILEIDPDTNTGPVLHNWYHSWTDATAIVDDAAGAVPIVRIGVSSNYTYTIKAGNVLLQNIDGNHDRPAVTMNQAGDAYAIAEFLGATEAGVAKNITSWKTGATLSGFVKVKIGAKAGAPGSGTDYWMPYYAAPTS